MTDYEPALAQTLEGPNHQSTGRPRWARAIYAADGTQLDLIVYDEVAWPAWTDALAQLPPVKVSAGEFDRWARHAAETGPVVPMREATARERMRALGVPHRRA